MIVQLHHISLKTGLANRLFTYESERDHMRHAVGRDECHFRCPVLDVFNEFQPKKMSSEHWGVFGLALGQGDPCVCLKGALRGIMRQQRVQGCFHNGASTSWKHAI